MSGKTKRFTVSFFKLLLVVLLIEMFLLFFFIYYSRFIRIIYFIIPGDIDLVEFENIYFGSGTNVFVF